MTYRSFLLKFCFFSASLLLISLCVFSVFSSDNFDYRWKLTKNSICKLKIGKNITWKMSYISRTWIFTLVILGYLIFGWPSAKVCTCWISTWRSSPEMYTRIPIIWSLMDLGNFISFSFFPLFRHYLDRYFVKNDEMEIRLLQMFWLPNYDTYKVINL